MSSFDNSKLTLYMFIVSCTDWTLACETIIGNSFLTDKDGKDYSDIKLIVDIVEVNLNTKLILNDRNMFD